MAEVLINDYQSTLSAQLAAGDGPGSTITVASGVPAAAVGTNGRVRIGSAGSLAEIVLVTFTTTTSWTVVTRAVEDSSRFPAATWPIGTPVRAVLTAGGLSAVIAIATGKTLWVDQTNGSDSTGVRGQIDKPYLTLAAAKAAASSGDVIEVRPGDYAATESLAKVGVSWFFQPGSVVTVTGSVLWQFNSAGSYGVFGRGRFASNGGVSLVQSDHADAEWVIECEVLDLPENSQGLYLAEGFGLIRGATINGAGGGHMIDTNAPPVSADSEIVLDQCRIIQGNSECAIYCLGDPVHCPLILRDCVIEGTPFSGDPFSIAIEGCLTLDTAPIVSVTITGGIVVRSDTGTASATAFNPTGLTTNRVTYYSGSALAATAFTYTTNKLSTAGTSATLEQTGDSLGATRLVILNRSGAAGARFENDGIELVDFIFKGTGSTTRTMRYENRGGGNNWLGTPEFQIGGSTAGRGTLIVADPASGTATMGDSSSQTPRHAWLNASTTTFGQTVFDISTPWATATHASRKGRAVLSVWDTAAREAIRMEASGSAPMLGFFGVTAVVRPTALTAANNGTINSGDGTTDTIIGNMRTRIAELESKLQALGLLT